MGADERRRVLEQVEAGTERVLATLGKLSEQELRGPSALPGWTRGHVATHIARNADSLWNLLEWARTGVEIPQYPSVEARNADLEAGAGRGGSELVEDVRASAARFSEQFRALPPEAADVQVRAMLGWEQPAWYVLYRRWHEVEVHHVDLAAGYGPADWPDPYVRWALGGTLRDLAALPVGSRGELDGHRLVATESGDETRLGDGPRITGSGRALLGWLSGRTSGAGLAMRPDGALPAPPAWPFPPSTF
ncbi:maleylpyruvate isomerase family mycothiol-dependent enzyme [Actinomadura hibisca]|uniref:maleylpyruvate isomerase family mycothiol-dependent enzyme n=1 Tax=Actinomadura hibisca TaxID=68565 RepID=UPI000831B2D2|nr:maleylpyruvate isomerase family mycothiol-dependent enzyme [Actinomadura hibisca]